MDNPRVFALPLGVDFAKELVVGLITRMADQPPEAMARVQLYLNSGRTQRRVREEFDRHGARFLPHLRLVTDLGQQPLLGVPAAVPALRRKLELAQLVALLTERLPGFETGGNIFSLADSLAQLMAEMQTEGVPPTALERLEIDETHAQHWQYSLEFIKIVSHYFEVDTAPDPDARQRRVVEALIALWQKAPPQNPIIIAGSTASRGTTSLLMEAVARLPNGRIVLPGFDYDMTEMAWDSLCSGPFPNEDHPQFRLHALLGRLGLTPAEVPRWTDTAPPSPRRNALISLALRPAPVTDQWMTEGRDLGDLGPACKDLTLLAAPDARREALALALILREAADRGVRAALITPDRMLSRRVSAALERWGIVADDSAGEPLNQTAPGRLLRHIAGLRGRKLALESLLVLLKHPLTATGSTLRGAHLRFTREIELELRRKGPAFPEAADFLRWAGSEEPARRDWAIWLGAALSGIEDASEIPLSACVETHLEIIGALAAGPGGTADTSELWREDAGEQCRRLFEELKAEAAHGGPYSPAAYADLVNRLLQNGTVRQTRQAHPNIAIWGTLEARVQDAELVILAGLNEGVWPESPAPDPWLSRKMRLDSGLLLPERKTGLSAHDFQQAIAAPQVILSRARRSSDAETVPSRWLNRFINLLNGLPAQNGPKALNEMTARGDYWLQLAEAVGTPREALPSAPRPSPQPPVAVRPRELPVTAIKTLIRDPYAIYARRILRLSPLDPLRPEPDPRLRGQVLHKIVERFVKERPADEPQAEGEARLLRISQEVLARDIAWPSAQHLWHARISRIAAKFVADEAQRATEGVPAIIEKKGSVPLENLGFLLTAKPDRIDILPDGTVHVFDYKSGLPPSDKEVLYFDKQLPLEAAMVERGAFPEIGPRGAGPMTYVRLGGDGETRTLAMKDETIAQVWDKLRLLIAAYQRPDQGYTARRALQKETDVSDYDHLSRYGEWEMSDPANAEKLE
ncbi:MAG: double-strand break repair protein AddB [Paracoccaceae bacterium]|nr:double-strand break repair protein AddB [Paracoccaceae bacterium]